MKKQLFLLVFMLLPLTGSAAVQIDGIYYNLDSDAKTAEVTRRQPRGSYSGDIIIPTTVVYEDTNYSVISIGESAFNGAHLTSINIPNSITTIGKSAFESSNLSSITIGTGVTSIGSDAFKDCRSLTVINRVVNIGKWCENDPISYENEYADPMYRTNDINDLKELHLFSDGDMEITDLVIPDGVTSIRSYAFRNCVNFTSATIPNSVTSISGNAFYHCWKMKKVVIDSHAIVSRDYTRASSQDYESSIEYMFGSQVKEYVLGESVTSVGQYAFAACYGLTTMTIGNHVETIGEGAFCSNSSLTSLIIGSSVINIGDIAFEGCYGLTSITIPNSVTTIGDKAFSQCFNLTSLTIPNSVTTIGNEAFAKCSEIASVNIGNSVTTIGDYAFYYCTNLASVIIGNGVTTIEDGAFGACNNLTNVYCYAEQVPETNNAFTYSNYTNATLHVPAISIDAYKNAEQWKDFGNIVALTDPSGIEATRASQEPAIVEHYTIDGKRVNQPQRGLNIIKMSDGTTKKVVVK